LLHELFMQADTCHASDMFALCLSFTIQVFCHHHEFFACAAPAVLQDEFAAEMAALAAQTAAARQEQAAAESALAGVQRELAAQQAIAADIAALEERYWHDLNEYQLSLQQHISERDGLLQRIDRAGQQLLLLKSTNVLNDTFRWAQQ
jgi:hypothetical protein